MATTKLKGNEVTLVGNELFIGDLAPIVNIAGRDLTDFKVGGEKDCTQVIVVVPSLDTPVCAAETRRFNEEASKLENSEIIVISMDLPFAMGRFCTTEGIENLIVGSDFRNKEFANAYGVLINDGPLKGLTSRAIFIINTNGEVAYKELCEEITEEPDYNKALEALKNI